MLKLTDCGISYSYTRGALVQWYVKLNINKIPGNKEGRGNLKDQHPKKQFRIKNLVPKVQRKHNLNPTKKI
jgi:hypothetical protein